MAVVWLENYIQVGAIFCRWWRPQPSSHDACCACAQEELAGILVVVSHDRAFLNCVCTDIVHLYKYVAPARTTCRQVVTLDDVAVLCRETLTYYRGDYDTFERTRIERAKHQQSAFESNEAKRKHMQAFIDRFRYNANRAALVQSRIKAMERMECVEEVCERCEVDVVLRETKPHDVCGSLG
jgi:ATPase subunit of ABC transporter with duplicated ATPase domains